MLKALNYQIYEEMNSAYIYTGMASWLGSQGLRGMEKWMKKQVEEEIEHTEKIYDYVSVHGKVELKALPAPLCEWESSYVVFEKAMQHEEYITGCIEKLYGLAEEQSDEETMEFLRWFIKEQDEEENNAEHNLEIIKKDEKKADEEMGKR